MVTKVTEEVTDATDASELLGPFVDPYLVENLHPECFKEADKPGKENARIYDLLARCTHRINMELRDSLVFEEYDAVNAARVLRVLATRRRIRPRDVASELGLTRPTVTELLKHLERKGFVEMFPDDRDRRCKRLKLTDAGWAERDAIDRITRWLMHLLIEQFSAAQKESFLALLEKLHNAVSYIRVRRIWGEGPRLYKRRRVTRRVEGLIEDDNEDE